MNQIDKLILLAVLGAVGGLLLFLLRRAGREREAMPVVVVPPTPVKIEEQAALAVVKSAPIPVAAAIESPTVADVVVPSRQVKKKSVAPAPASSVQSPVQKMLGMLKEKDTLAAAFVLREILAPPVSKR